MDETTLKLRLFEQRYNDELQRGLNLEFRALSAEARVTQLEGILNGYDHNGTSSTEDLRGGNNGPEQASGPVE